MTPINKGKLIINKSTIEWTLIIIIMMFSLINIITLIISFVLLLGLLKQKEVGAIKILNLITLRTIINTNSAINIAILQEVKWIIILGCSFYLILSYRKLETKEKNKINPIITMSILFFIYNVIVSFFLGSLPIISIFKLISFTVVFLSVLIGIAYTSRNMKWINWMYILMTVLVIPSIFTVALPIGYIHNSMSSSFQGLTNQPNAFGVVSVLFIALLLTKQRIYNSFNKYMILILIIITAYMIVLSKSRTAFLSIILLIILYMITKKIKRFTDITMITFSISLITLIFLNKNITNFISEFLYKGQREGELLKSREGQIGELTANFFESPWLGNGFLTPKLQQRSYEFNFDVVVEPGNILLAVLSYSGIIGFLIFFLFILMIIKSNNKMILNLFFLPLSVLIVNMAEMSFFSSNNTGIWMYMFLSIYVFTELKYSNEIIKNKKEGYL